MEMRATNVIAFAGTRCLAQGALVDVALDVKAAAPEEPVLLFDTLTSQPIELDLRGSAAEIRARYTLPPAPAASPGRPKLGVVPREVTLLPRHWEWLGQQPGGASVALRKLVEDARRTSEEKDRLRQAQEALYRFLHALAGDLPGYEEALRALYAPDRARFDAQLTAWPEDIVRHARHLAERAFPV